MLAKIIKFFKKEKPTPLKPKVVVGFVAPDAPAFGSKEKHIHIHHHYHNENKK